MAHCTTSCSCNHVANDFHCSRLVSIIIPRVVGSVTIPREMSEHANELVAPVYDITRVIYSDRWSGCLVSKWAYAFLTHFTRRYKSRVAIRSKKSSPAFTMPFFRSLFLSCLSLSLSLSRSLLLSAPVNFQRTQFPASKCVSHSPTARPRSRSRNVIDIGVQSN